MTALLRLGVSLRLYYPNAPISTPRTYFVLLLSLLLASCAGNLQPAKDGPLSSTLTLTPTQASFSLDRSALSYGIFETDATSVIVNVSSTISQEFSSFADISIEDGSGVTTYKVERGESTIIHSMPMGQKRVVITSGGQAKLNGETTGVFINKITFNGSAIQIEQDNKRIVVYGDSIAVGGSVNSPSAEAWPVLLRKHYAVIVDAYGYGALHDDASTQEKRAELASKISAWMPDYVWLAIGTNDYALGQWSAHQFGEAYAATLDSIHSSSPHSLLFAQSPILRENEVVNSLGDDLESYRRQIAIACLARATWCIFVDGKNAAFPQPNELNKDGIHLTTKSSVKYAQAVLNIIDK